MRQYIWGFFVFVFLLALPACQGTKPKEAGLRITSPANTSSFQVGQTLNFSGEGTDLTGKNLGDAALSWELRVFLNDSTASATEKLSSLEGKGSFEVADYGDELVRLELCLSASGLESACVRLLPQKANYRFETKPAGLMLEWEGESRQAPFEVRALVGAERKLSAPLAQDQLEFASWNDVGLATRTLLIGSAPQTLVANYEELSSETCGPLVQEAEDGIVFGAMQIYENALASGGKYISSDEDSEPDFVQNPDARHRVDYCMKVVTPGTYRLKTFVAGPSTGSDSFLVQVNNETAINYSFSYILKPTNPFPAFTKDYVREAFKNDPATFELAAGEQKISFYLREDAAQLDKLELELLTPTLKRAF